MALTKKQRLFVDEYLIDLNATQAAIRAGYSARRATEIGYQLLQRPEVAQAIQAAMAERSKRTEVEADYVIRRLREIDEMDVLDILEDDGSFRSIRDWPRAWRQFLSGIEIAELFEAAETTAASPACSAGQMAGQAPQPGTAEPSRRHRVCRARLGAQAPGCREEARRTEAAGEP